MSTKRPYTDDEELAVITSAIAENGAAGAAVKQALGKFIGERTCAMPTPKQVNQELDRLVKAGVIARMAHGSETFYTTNETLINQVKFQDTKETYMTPASLGV